MTACELGRGAGDAVAFDHCEHGTPLFEGHIRMVVWHGLDKVLATRLKTLRPRIDARAVG